MAIYSHEEKGYNDIAPKRNETPMGIEERKAGEAIRREVMGTAHVDRSLGNASEFDMPLQEATMENAWGSVWTRDGLDR